MVVEPLRSAPTVEAQKKTILHTKAETGDSLGGVTVDGYCNRHRLSWFSSGAYEDIGCPECLTKKDASSQGTQKKTERCYICDDIPHLRNICSRCSQPTEKIEEELSYVCEDCDNIFKVWNDRCERILLCPDCVDKRVSNVKTEECCGENWMAVHEKVVYGRFLRSMYANDAMEDFREMEGI